MGSPPPSDNVFIGDLPAHLTMQDCETIFSGYGTVVQCKVMEPKQEGRMASALVRFGSVEEAQWVVDNLNGNLAEGLDEPIIVRFANPPGSKFEKGEKGGYGKGGGKDWDAGGWNGGGYTVRAEPYGGKGAKGGGWSFSSGAEKGGCKGGGKSAPGSFRNLYGAVKKAGLLGDGSFVPNECQVYVKNLPADTSDLDLYRLFSPFGALAPSGVKAMLDEGGVCKGIGFVDFMDGLSAQAVIESLNGFAMPDGSSIQLSTKASGGGKGKGKDKGKE